MEFNSSVQLAAASFKRSESYLCRRKTQISKIFHVVDSKGDANFIKFEDAVGVEMK